ncbi:hypothetical protein [Modestobacter lapidis]
MDVFIERCAGIDIGKHEVVAWAAEATYSTPNGWPSYSSTACCGAASCRRRRSGNCGT